MKDFVESNYSIANRVIDTFKDARDSVYRLLGKETPDNGLRYFERALGTRQPGVDTGTRYATRIDRYGNKYWEIDTDKDIFKGLETADELQEAAYKLLLDNRDNNVVVEDSNGRKIKFIRLSAKEFTRGRLSNDLKANNPTVFKQKMRMIPSLQDILLNNSTEWESPDLKDHKLFKEKGFKNYRGKVKIDNVILTQW